MRKFLFVTSVFTCFAAVCAAQPRLDSVYTDNVFIDKDPRIDMLGRKMAEYNESLATKARIGKGYRLMVISTNDRDLAMQVRANLYRLFPEHKQYMSYQLPNIKIKLGNFTDRGEAEKFRKFLIAQRLVQNNIYILPEMVEIKPEKKDPGASD